MTAIPDTRTAYEQEAEQEEVPPLPAGFHVHNGRLYQQGIDLLDLMEHPVSVDGRIEMPTTPMYVRRLPALRHNYHQLNNWFQSAKAQTGFSGDLTVAYASKANPSQEVVRTLLQEGAAYECSSTFDVEVVRLAHSSGWVSSHRTILANGFKISSYAHNLIRLRAEGFNHLLPIFDDIDELTAFAESGLSFEVGLRSRTDSNSINRFGMNPAELETAARVILETPNLKLTTFHAMQTVSAKHFLPYQVAMMHSLRVYAQLRRIVPTLHRFNLGGGLPGFTSGLNFEDWMTTTLRAVMYVCQDEEIPVPDLMIESGRFLTQDHACKMFRVVKTKIADDGIPFYFIDGSIMSNFPDAWALGDQFTVLPVSNWHGPFRRARLCGLTCDPDDVYPTRKMEDKPLLLPANTNGLVLGFFDCGAYQETLSGRNGAKHCLLPEGPEMVLDENDYGDLCSSYHAGQNVTQVLSNLGYAVN